MQRTMTDEVVERIIARALAAVLLLTTLVWVPRAVAQSAAMARWWNRTMPTLVIAATVLFTVAALRGRRIRPAGLAVAGVVVLALLTWPLACADPAPLRGQPLWVTSPLPTGLTVGMLSLGLLRSIGLALVCAVTLFLLRPTPRGGGVSLLNAYQDSMVVVVVVVITGVPLVAMRRILHSLDRAARSALEEYIDVRRAEELASERTRLDGLVHDEVMTALVLAAQAGTARQWSSAAGLARDALDLIDALSSRGSLPRGHGSPPDVIQRVRQAVRAHLPSAGLELEQHAPEPIPAEVVDALVGACNEALRNVARHVPDDVPDAVVRLRAVGRSVTISVRDHGPGFDVARVPTSRLGLSVSITQRMSCVGGRARVVSRPGWGTEVLLGWPAESMPGPDG